MSHAIETTRLWTVEDLDDSSMTSERVELWEGQLFEMPPPMSLHNRAAARAFYVLMHFCLGKPGLVCVGQCEGFVIQEHPATLYCPDASVYRERGSDIRKRFHFSPEVAVEVLSPENNAKEMGMKISRYLGAGSEQVWILDPEKRTLAIHFADGRRLHADGGRVPCEGILDGLVVDLDFVFERAAAEG